MAPLSTFTFHTLCLLGIVQASTSSCSTHTDGNCEDGTDLVQMRLEKQHPAAFVGQGVREEADIWQTGDDTTMCIDSPADWKSSSGVDCALHKENQFCTKRKGFGPGWDPARMGKFEDWATKGIAATDACCACGGGDEVPIRISFQLTVDNADYNAISSNPTLRVAIPNAIRDAVAQSVGVGTLPEHVEAQLSEGASDIRTATYSTVARVSVGVHGGSGASELRTAIFTATDMASNVANAVSTLTGINAVSTGGIGVSQISAPTLPGHDNPTHPPSPQPTPAPTPYPMMGPIGFDIVHEPPYRMDGYDGESYVPSNIMRERAGSWLGPDQRNQQNETLFFILDLRAQHYVGELEITNCWDTFCHHYFVNDYRISMGDDGVMFGSTISGTLETKGEPQRAPVGFTHRYLKFDCLTYGVSAGMTSVSVIGNEVLPIRSCLSSDSATEHECHTAFDQITTESSNGWVNHPFGAPKLSNQPSWVIMNVGGGPEVNRVGIYSGIGRSDHSINNFKLEVKTGGAFQEVVGLAFMGVGPVSQMADSNVTGNRAMCKGQDIIQMSFEPIFSAEAVKLYVYGSNDPSDDNAILNEFYIYRAPPPPTPAPTMAPTLSCVGTPAGWVSAGGSDCPSYYHNHYCTYSGGYGPGWEFAFGNFDLWALDGIGPLTACCGCGGGKIEICGDYPGWKSSVGMDCGGYVDDGFCTDDGGYGSGWLPQYGTFGHWAVEGVSALHACCGCGGGCTDNSAWTSSTGDNCETYSANSWCDTDGNYGKNWNAKWGQFKDYGNNGVDALKACCACGGGSRAPCHTFTHDTSCPQSHCKWTGATCEPSKETVVPIPGFCIEQPRGWMSQGGSNCEHYIASSYCTAEGGYGSGWEESFAIFDVWATNGISAVQACCGCGGGTGGKPEPGFPAANDKEFMFVEVGRGYCGATREEEVSHRIGGWQYQQTKEQADQSCKNEPRCQGYHWSIQEGQYIMLDAVGNTTCCESEQGDLCYKKEAVTATPQPTKPDEPPFYELGRGYCGNTIQEEVANRMGNWVYGFTRVQAGQSCLDTPACMGIHWNEADASFVMLSHVGDWTCCESHKGDVCYKRRPVAETSSVAMPDPCADPTGRVTLSMNVQGVEYIKQDALSTAIKNAIAAEAGSKILPSHVQIMHLSGGAVQVSIQPPKDVDAAIVKSTLGSSKTLVETLQDVILAIPVPPGTDVTSVGVSNVTPPKVEAIFCGDSAVAHLNKTAEAASVNLSSEAAFIGRRTELSPEAAALEAANRAVFGPGA